MKRLCFGSFATVLKHCMVATTSQKVVCGTMLLSLAPNYDIRADDTAVSYLLSCRNGLSKDVTDVAPTADAKVVAQFFEANLLPLLDGNKRALLVLAIKDVLADDSEIQPDTPLNKDSGTTKENLLSKTEINLSDFLAEIFLYIVINVKNTDGKSSIGEITSEYVNSFESNRGSISFVFTNNKYDSEFSFELSPDLAKFREMLAKLPHPKTLIPPEEISSEELPYITALLEAYADAEGLDVLTRDELAAYKKYKTNFERQRKDYYAAESVRRSTMEVFSGLEEDQFETLKTETHDGVIDIHSQDFNNGFARLNAVMSQASVITISKCLLIRETDWIGNSEKKGVCHFLVNDGRLRWVAGDE